MRLSKQPLSDQAYEMLVKQIITRAIAPGTRLTEESVSAEFGISRTPVRDALARLEQEGLVESAGKGCQVKQLSPERCAELFACRAMIEVLALRNGFAALPRTELIRLREELAEAAGDARKTTSIHVDSALHKLICEHCGNPFLYELLAKLQRQCDAFRCYRTAEAGTELQAISDERLHLLDAMLEGDVERAAKLLESHIRRGGSILPTQSTEK